MYGEKRAKVVLQSRDLENGNKVATLISKKFTKQLYQNEDKGLVYFENGKQYHFMEMISEHDHDKIIESILEYQFESDEETKTIEIQFEHYNK